jgi:MSHA biogenesis protein MshM
MYLEHYGLRELPFSLTPDTSFFFGYGHYRDAYNTLLVALQNGEGFIKVTGEVGTGKTLLCRKLLNSLGDEFATAYIPNPYLNPTALIMAVAEELGIELDVNAGAHRATKQITERLIELVSEGKKVVLCIDEAQAMPEQTLETLRLMTNLETEKRKLLQVVLFGQPELDQMLEQKSIRQLRQRITFSYTLQPLDTEGIAAYLQHRLLVAGGDGEVGFDSAAVKQLYRGSSGFPRLINILAHKALMLGYGQGTKRIGASQVKAAITDTEGAIKKQASNGNKLILQRALAVSLAGALMVFGYQYLNSEKLAALDTPSANEASIPASDTAEVIPDTPKAVAEVAPPPVVEVAATVPEEPVPELAPVATAEPEIPPVPSLNAITPSRVSGSWRPQHLLLHGEYLPDDARVIVNWSGREKLLPAERVEWLDPNTLRVTLTTGMRSTPWQIQLVYPGGERSDAVKFEVIGDDQESET